MLADFLRHIVNPILNSYVERGLPPKVANELKKLIAEAESKYAFDAFSGNPVNITKYLLSEDFKTLIDAFKAAGALDALLEILEKTKEAYQSVPEIVNAVEQLLEGLRKGLEVKPKEVVNLEELLETLKKSPEVEITSASHNAVKARIGREVEIKIRLLKSGVRLEFKINTLAKHKLKVLLKRVRRFVEEVSSI
jgi:archaellum component FlaC